jgi:uncharacterized NAD(P)/FAD-binding protein YdhS
MKKIGIIGGGFAGTMTAIQLIEKASAPCEIIVINKTETFNKGIAYHPYSNKHLLNVIAQKMSAFPDKPTHFLDWVMSLKFFKEKDPKLVANSFLPRQLYGDYLQDVWEAAINLAATKQLKLTVIEGFAVDLEVSEKTVSILLENEVKLDVRYCVIATGNHNPRNPTIKNMEFYKSPNYFQNPWVLESVTNTKENLPVLIIGNGLTMVDTVFGLLENGFKGEIYSISPNGLNILPHSENVLVYSMLVDELDADLSLYELLKLVNKHIKLAKNFGISAEPIIDSLRPLTQKIWKALSEKEKALFMSRLRHLWGMARHRIPLSSHDKIQQLRMQGELHINSGKIIDFIENNDFIHVEYFDKKLRTLKTLKVSRIINCTGPESDLMQLETSFLKNCLLNGVLVQDTLKLGIKTDATTLQLINSEGKNHSNLFTLGSNLKGELWESTAVNELRVQAEKLAENILKING